MADVLIRGMEMPQRCKACRFCGFGGRRSELNVCMFTGESQPKLSQERMSKCPLVPLPEGHGRLGDLTEIEKKLQKTLDEMGDRWLSSPSMMAQRVAIVADLKKVKETPTIIPAEGVGEDG